MDLAFVDDQYRKTGICISLDNTLKVAAKATIVDTSGSHLKLMKGGILSVINERSLILAWVCTMGHSETFRSDPHIVEVVSERIAC